MLIEDFNPNVYEEKMRKQKQDYDRQMEEFFTPLRVASKRRLLHAIFSMASFMINDNLLHVTCRDVRAMGLAKASLKGSRNSRERDVINQLLDGPAK